MLGRDRTTHAQQLAEDAWDTLVSTWHSAREHAGELVDETQDRVGSITGEARRRASAAYDALAGHRAAVPWALLLGAVAAGAVVGWVAAAAIRRSPGLPSLPETDDAALEPEEAP